MAAEGSQQQEAAAASSSGSGAASCAGGDCWPYGSTPMCAEKIARPMQELEGVLAEIRRVNAGKKAERDGRIAKANPAAHGGATRALRTRDCC